MKVFELIEELKNYDPNMRVVLCAHGAVSAEEQDEILGSFTEDLFDENNEKIETVVFLYEY